MSTTITTDDFDYIRALVREQAAIVLESGKEYLVESRLSPLAIKEGLESVPELVAALRKPSVYGLRKKVVDAMTTNETSFFRDVEPFEVMKKHIIPELAAARKDEQRLQFWCAASSTGQEPYTVAMLMRETFPQLATWDVRFTATDISQEVLEECRSGKYSQLEVSRGLPANYLIKYFEKQGREWQVKEFIRKMLTFQELNLTQPWPVFPPMDIVFIRNVLIYFDVETKRKILSKIRGLLRPDGYLFLGGAETTLNLDDNFERMPYERSGCYRLKK